VLKCAATGVGDGEHPRGPAASPVPVHPRRPALDQAAIQQLIEVPPDRRRREAKRAPKRGRADRPVLQDQPGNPGTRALLSPRGATRAPGGLSYGTGMLPWLSHVFHNIIVP
jgi:hypothetical protein